MWFDAQRPDALRNIRHNAQDRDGTALVIAAILLHHKAHTCYTCLLCSLYQLQLFYQCPGGHVHPSTEHFSWCSSRITCCTVPTFSKIACQALDASSTGLVTTLVVQGLDPNLNGVTHNTLQHHLCSITYTHIGLFCYPAGLQKYGWEAHDGHSFGRQELYDTDVRLTTSWVST